VDVGEEQAVIDRILRIKGEVEQLQKEWVALNQSNLRIRALLGRWHGTLGRFGPVPQSLIEATREALDGANETPLFRLLREEEQLDR
jgi:hypothetical protein